MILTLSARSLRSMLVPLGRGKKPAMELFDLPKFTRETLGLSGLTFSTDMLVGADRTKLEALRERADRVGCACLLLVESQPHPFGSNDLGKVQAAADRMMRVVEAAHVLGCSAAAVQIEAQEEDDITLFRAAQALKPVVQRAEKLDISLLIAPHVGLTHKPDRVTELLKKIGGFRIGTFPDFEAAAASGDPASYMHRLTPYAAAICAATYKLVDNGTDLSNSAKASRGLDPRRGKAAATPDPRALDGKPRGIKDADLEEVLAKVLKKSAGAKSIAKPTGKNSGKLAEKLAAGKSPLAPAATDAKPPPKGRGKQAKPMPEAIATELAVGLGEDGVDPELDELEAIIEEAIAEEEEAMKPLVAMTHEPYSLVPMIQAVTAVGYDGALTIDYRGTDDVVTSITKTRDTLLAMLTAEREKRLRDREKE